MFEQKVKEIAVHFPEFPILTKDHDNRFLIHPADTTDVGLIFWRNLSKPNRIHIFGLYPESPDNLPPSMFMPYHSELPSITVGLSRPALKVANDIKRRFYEAYKKIYPEVKRKVESHIAKLRRVENSKLLITENFLSQAGYQNQIYSMKPTAKNSWHAKIYSDGQIKLELNYLDIETAMTIIALLED